ncbi:MFS transporter [uncultured Sphaerochaeta sp.]|uniref:MFS transporter n=1 Tax=uncultured Sphaerochaeta sp. TaxID=886478 RepID=UPI002A0A38F6|nr:MFS transporter [uncultured Sphaerochaeta sp.]
MNNTSRRALVLMNLSAFCSGMVFYAPVATLYRQTRGLDLAQIALIEAISLALTLALELPWGHLADRIGYRLTLVISFFFLFISKIVFFSAFSFSLFVVERVLLAIANSAASGVDTAYLASFDSRQKTFGVYQGFQFAGLVVVALAFPFFSKVYHDSALLTIFSNGLAFIFILFLPREVPDKVLQKKKKHVPLRVSLEQVWKDWPFLIFIASVSLLFSVNQVVTVFLVQVCYRNAGLDASSFGYPFLILVVLSFLAAVLSTRLTEFFGKIGSFILCFALSFLGVLLLAWQKNLVVVLLGVFALRFGAAALYPLVISIEAKQAQGKQSATILSVYALFSEGIELLLTLVLGTLANTNLSFSLLLAGGIVLIGLFGILQGRKFPVIGQWLS